MEQGIYVEPVLSVTSLCEGVDPSKNGSSILSIDKAKTNKHNPQTNIRLRIDALSCLNAERTASQTDDGASSKTVRSVEQKNLKYFNTILRAFYQYELL